MRVERVLRACVIALIGCASQARAQAGRPALHWSRAPEAQTCIDPRSLAQRVETLTGPALVAAGEAEISIEGHIEPRAGGGFRARISVSDQRGTQMGTRVLEYANRDCRALDAGLALVIATLIDPALGSQGVPPEVLELGVDETPPEQALLQEIAQQPSAKPALQATSATQPAAVAPTQASTFAAKPPRAGRSPSRPNVRLEAGAILVQGPLRDGSADAGVAFGAAYQPLPWLALGLQLDGLASLAPTRLDGARSLRAQTVSLAALVCPELAFGARVEGELCVGPELALLWARGRGFAQDELARLGRTGARALLGLRVRIAEHWHLGAHALIQLGFGDKRFSYERGGQHLETAALRRVALGGLVAIDREL